MLLSAGIIMKGAGVNAGLIPPRVVLMNKTYPSKPPLLLSYFQNYQ